MTRKILIVDDDQKTRTLLKTYLEKNQYEVRLAHNGEAFLAEFQRYADELSLVILDVMLPDTDGFALCKIVRRKSNVPIIMLTASSDETDRVVGLELGADDYVPKPCNPRELLARVRAVLRRRQEPRTVDDGMGAACEFAGWRLDLVRRELRSPQSVVVNLSSGEFSLLRAFVERPQRVLTRDQLLDLARGRESDAYDRAIDVQISRLRRKLDDGGGGELIRTIRSEGYMFTSKVTRTP